MNPDFCTSFEIPRTKTVKCGIQSFALKGIKMEHETTAQIQVVISAWKRMTGMVTCVKEAATTAGIQQSGTTDPSSPKAWKFREHAP